MATASNPGRDMTIPTTEERLLKTKTGYLVCLAVLRLKGKGTRQPPDAFLEYERTVRQPQFIRLRPTRRRARLVEVSVAGRRLAGYPWAEKLRSSVL